MREIRLDSLVFHANATVAETGTDLDEFWISLGPDVGYAQFIRQHPGQARFLLRQVRSAHSPVPSPLASVRGVLWSRRAAIEADRSIASYRAGAGQTPGSSPQSVTSGCRHEA